MSLELRLLDPSGAEGPPLLSSADLAGARAVTRSAWYVLSGRHSRSQVVLRVRPESLARWHEAARLAVSRGSRVAVVLNGKTVAVMMLTQAPADAELVIDASFFSTGTERDKAREATALARTISAGLD